MPERDKEPDDASRLDEERVRREAEELESFERRAEWWRLHYGVPPERADELTREAVEQAERMASEPDTPPDSENEAQ